VLFPHLVWLGLISLRKTTRLLLWILTVTALCCKHFSLQNCEGWGKGWKMYGFKKDSAMAHTARQSMTFLWGMFQAT
jgi:hypothetical protein